MTIRDWTELFGMIMTAISGVGYLSARLTRIEVKFGDHIAQDDKTHTDHENRIRALETLTRSRN